MSRRLRLFKDGSGISKPPTVEPSFWTNDNDTPRNRARGASSPDRAEALMLALGEPPPVFGYMSVASLRTPGFERDGFDQDDLGFARRRKRTRWDSY